MKRFGLGIFLLIANHALGQVILTEVMFNPSGSENANEFVELYNMSDSDSVSLSGWRIGDQNAHDEIIPFESGLALGPRQFAVILDPGYFDSSTQYDSLIPPDALVLTIDDNTLGSGGLSNSTAETVRLLNSAGQVVAEYTYSIDNADGFSDEKIELIADNSLQNWANSLRVNGTPGGKNSVAPVLFDGELVRESLQIHPRQLREGMRATVSIVVRNAGIQPLSNYAIDFELVPVSREFGAPIYLGQTTSASSLANGDTLRLNLTTPELSVGRFRLHAFLLHEDDANVFNDTLSVPIAIGWRREVVVINEIMFSPPSRQPEWIELFNPQAFNVPLPDWVVEDEAGGKGLVEQTVFIPPRSYRIISASNEIGAIYNLPDSVVIILNKLPSLNNNGDAIVLRDFSGAIIDSIAYESDWGEPQKSIEKIWYERNNLKRNWLPSKAASGATPAAFNSVSPREYDLGIGSFHFKPARPHFGEQVELIVSIRNHGRQALMNFSVRFFSAPGRQQNWQELGRVDAQHELLAEDSVVVLFEWPNPPSGRNNVRVELEETNDLIADNNQYLAQLPVGYETGSVVINEIYYAPLSGEPEWFELYNASADALDLSEWLWRDAEEDIASLEYDDSILAPNAYAVVSREDVEIPFFDPTALHLSSNKWFSLNNDEDAIAVWDFNGGFQDSVRFNHEWGGDTGLSLERINPRLAAKDSSNWSTCVDSFGATPGRQNSIFTSILPNAAIVSITPNPFSPDNDGVDDFAILQLQLPVATAAANVKVYDLRGRLIRELLNNRAVGSNFEIVWNGRDDSDRPVRTGLYVVYMEVIKPEEGILLSAKTVVVLARSLN